MLAICIRLAAAIHGYLAFYMPTNRAVGWLRSPNGIKVGDPRRDRGDADVPIRHERLHDDHRARRTWLPPRAGDVVRVERDQVRGCRRADTVPVARGSSADGRSLSRNSPDLPRKGTSPAKIGGWARALALFVGPLP